MRSLILKNLPRFLVFTLFLCVAANAADKRTSPRLANYRFEISFARELSATPLDRHVLLVFAHNNDDEPRFPICFMTPQSHQILAVDVPSLPPGTPAVI